MLNLRLHISFKTDSYYEGIQDACLKGNGENLEVIECPEVLNSLIAWEVENGHIQFYGGKCLFHKTDSNSAATLKPCDDSPEGFVSVIPYRSSPYGLNPYPYPYEGLSRIFPTR